MKEKTIDALRSAAVKIWPKAVFPNLRKAIKDNLGRVSVQRRISEMADADLTFVEPWAFIRVKDERKTLLASLNSILPVIKKGVIAYNDCTDGSDVIIKDFCEKNPGFVPYEYPFYVEPAGSKKYSTGELEEKNTLAAYYNAVLSQIPIGEWVIKIDVDQIYFPEILKHSFSLPKNRSDFVSYSRLDVIRDGSGNLRVLRYARPGDHWLICNDGKLKFENVYLYDDEGKYCAYESLRPGKRNLWYKPECSSVHFPSEKKYRSYSGDFEGLMGFREFLDTCDEKEISRELLDAERIARVEFEC